MQSTIIYVCSFMISGAHFKDRQEIDNLGDNSKWISVIYKRGQSQKRFLSLIAKLNPEQGFQMET
jgi:hypothetical protein